MVLLAVLAVFFNQTMKNAQNYAEIQLMRQVQGTALSLGASISQAVIANDRATIDSLMEAIFEQGGFVDISLFNAADELITTHQTNPHSHRAPKWFVDWLPVQSVPGIFEVKHERKVVAKLKVYGDRDYLYRQLWVAANKTFFLVAIIGVVGWLVMLLLVRRTFRPLDELEKQAIAVLNKDFSSQQALPGSKDVRLVVQAMNRMGRQLKTLFDEQVAQIEQVRNQAYVDAVSGLGNGRFFNAQVDARIHAPEEPFVGALVRIQIGGLLGFNEQFGKPAGDAVLRQVGKIWQKALNEVEGHCVARVSGARFAALLPSIDAQVAQRKVNDALQSVKALDAFSPNGGRLMIHAGMSYCNVGENAHLLEAQADRALQKCAVDDANDLVFFDAEDHGDAISPAFSKVENWESLLKETIEDQKIIFHYQPILSCIDQSIMHYEVLARVDVEGELVNAGLFIPLVERYKLEESFDKLIITQLIGQLSATKAAERIAMAINLSPHSIRDDDFVDWLLDQVATHSDVSAYLIFEVPEITVRLSHGKLRRLAEGLKRVGAKLSIDHFGTTNSSFGYLSGLPLYSIKVDRSYIRDIENNLDHQFFVQSLVRIAHSRNVLLTAEVVEAQGQWDLLRSFQLDGAQGYYLGEPKASQHAA